MAVARESRLIVGCKVLKELGWVSMQEFVDRLPQASHYCTDRAAVYEEMMWPDGSTHVISHRKEQMHNIESLNADLRTYLGRLKRETPKQVLLAKLGSPHSCNTALRVALQLASPPHLEQL